MNRSYTGLVGYYILIIFLLIPSTVLARSVPMVKSVMVHFAELPPIQLPCGDLELKFYPGYAKYAETINLGKIDLLQKQYEQYLKQADKLKVILAKSLEDFLMAGYADFRARQSSDDVLQNAANLINPVPTHMTPTGVKFLYQQFIWYTNLSRAAYNDYYMRGTAEEYYKLITPLFLGTSYKNRVGLIEKLSTRLACLHEHRQEAFDKITKTDRISFEKSDNSIKNKPITIEEASKRASDIAEFSSYSREYVWMSSEMSSLTTILRTLLNAHETAVYNSRLHPKLRKAHVKYGAALGPADRFPKDAELLKTRRIRLEIAKIRAQVALNHMYLKQIMAEQIYTSQLNFSSGITAGASKAYDIAMKAGKDFIRTRHLLPYDKFIKDVKDFYTTGNTISEEEFQKEYKRDPGTVELALLLTAAELANSTFTLAVSSLKDLSIRGLQLFVDVKTSAEKALDTYMVEKKKVNFSIKIVERIIQNLDPDNPASFEQSLLLIKTIVFGKFSGSKLVDQAPNGIKRLLGDSGFIGATGGGLPWILEPLCESPGQRAALLINGARYALTGNARSAFHRIAFDRGLWIDNPALPLTKEILQGNSLSEYAETDFQKIMLAGNTNLIYSIPLIGDAKFAYDKIPFVRNLLKFEGKNEGDQDEFLLNLISQQEIFDQVLAALKRVRYNYSELSRKDPDSFNKHLLLLQKCPDYLAAWIKIRNAHWERSRMFNYARFSNVKSDKIADEGKALLASINKAHEFETTDLTAKLSWLNVEYNAYSINYIAAANELKVLQKVENMRRAAFGEKGKIDLSLSVTAFEKQARLSELTVATKNLVKQLAVSYITAGLVNKASNVIISKLPATWGLKAIPFDKTIGQDLLGALNPWVGAFYHNGGWDIAKGADGLLKNAVKDAGVDSLSQLTVKYLQIDKEWESSINQFYNFVIDIGENVVPPTINGFRATKEVATRLKKLDDSNLTAPIRSRLQSDNEINKSLVHAIRSKNRLKTRMLKKQIFERAQQAALDNDSLVYKKLKAGLEEALELEQHLRVSHKNNVQALEAGELTKALQRRRLIQAQQDDNTVMEITAGRLTTLADFKQEMNTGTPSIASLKKLTDTSDATGLHKHLLTDGFDIYLVRKGLQAAKDRLSTRMKIDSNNSKKYEAELEQIKEIAEQIDDKRIKLVNNMLEEFFILNPASRNMVVSVMQGGAAKDNPEYQGIFGDIDFTVLTKPGADGVKIKKDLEFFFKENNFPLATKKSNGYSTMDTEAFIQPVGNFDSSKESVSKIIQDVSVKMDDPTRFYTEAGGKWFINNMAYSGKSLWPPGKADAGSDKWARIPRVEAHGLALDMTRYLEFLTNPKYHSKKIAALGKSDPAKQKEVLGSVLKKTKYFIRLIDAYTMSHEHGNKLYHKRLENRKSKGDDASYHWQIYKDVENMINGGHKTIFNKGDLEIVKAMAKMKMKGDNPSPFDAIGDDKKGIEYGVAMVARMEELAADILAATAQVHLDETLAIVKNGSDAEKKKGASDQFRMASTRRKIYEAESFGTESMGTPKLKVVKKMVNNEVKTIYIPQTQEEHRDTIFKKNANFRRLREKADQYNKKKIDSLIADQPVKDPLGAETRRELDQLIEETFETDVLISEPTLTAFQNLALETSSGVKLNFALASKLLKSLENQPRKGSE